MNVLANPLLQHLDRRYGIGLLKAKKHWVIAGTLSAYWTRESLGMFLCLPYLMPTSSSSAAAATTTTATTNGDSNNYYSFSMTHYLILYSLLYHTYKSRGVRKDASQYASSSLGIMTLVIDEFYVHDVYEVLLSAFRLLLQGSDTFIHYCIVRDLLTVCSNSFAPSSSILLRDDENEVWSDGCGDNEGPPASYLVMVTRMHILFVIWMIHAALNQLFRCSTASIMVLWWQSLTRSNTMKTTTNMAKVEKVEDEQKKHSHPRQSKNPDVTDMKDELDPPDRTRSIASSSCSGVSTSSSGDDIDEDHDDCNARRSSSSTSSSDSGCEVGVDGCNLQTGYEKFIVRQLLLPNISIHDTSSCTMGRGARTLGNSSAVDGAVQLSIAIAALSVFFMLGLGQVPLKALPWVTMSIRTIGVHNYFLDENRLFVAVGLVRDHRQIILYLAMHSWLLWSLLHAIWSIFIRSPLPCPLQPTGSVICKRSIIQLIDLSVMLGVASYATILPSKDDGINIRRSSILLICTLLTLKAYAQSMRHPKVVRMSLGLMEFVSKLAVLRALTTSKCFGAMTEESSSVLSIIWVVWVLRRTSCELERDDNGHDHDGRVDVVFLGHPAFLSDSWALWLLPYSLKERWQAPFWAAPLWPIHYLVGWYVCNWGRKDYFLGDDCRYGKVRMQNWVAPHFGRQFVTHPHQVRKNIEACARYAEKIEVRVLCLGALNKAEVRQLLHYYKR